MNKYFTKLTFYSIILLASLVSCTKQKSEYLPALESNWVFITGECLASNQLNFYKGVANDYTTRVKSYKFVFRYDLAGDVVFVNTHNSEVKDPVWTFPYMKFVPADAVFSSFGENAPIVSKLYEETWRAGIDEDAKSSIFLDSGVSFIADKDFAGYDAGTNIAEEIISYNKWAQAGMKATYKPIIELTSSFQSRFNDKIINISPIVDALNNYDCFGDFICITIPIRDHKEIVEDITFTLTIPVKVGLYLTWLNDKLSDPDAPFPYYDDTLTCTFTVQRINAEYIDDFR